MFLLQHNDIDTYEHCWQRLAFLAEGLGVALLLTVEMEKPLIDLVDAGSIIIFMIE